MYTFTRWASVPENEAARAAIQQVAESVGAHRSRQAINPVFLHGPPGSGKTHLVAGLAAEVTRAHPDSIIQSHSAHDIGLLLQAESDSAEESAEGRVALSRCDLLIVEDLQHLAASVAGRLAAIIDLRLA